jgi:hypothetical protein
MESDDWLGEVEPERSTSEGNSELRVPVMSCVHVFDLQLQDLNISTHSSHRHRHRHLTSQTEITATPTKQNKQYKRHNDFISIPRDDGAYRQRETNLIDHYYADHQP